MQVSKRAQFVGRRVAAVLGAVALVVAATKGIAGVRGSIDTESSSSLDELPPIPPAVEGVPKPVEPHPGALTVARSLLGKSGALRFKTLTSAEALAIPNFVKALGERAIRTPAVHEIRLSDSVSFAYIVLRPFGEKRGEVLNGYRLGRWPAERWMMARNYYNPDGFVEVTEENARLRISEHFTLGDFVTHDQRAVWPKYVVLTEKLIDKLELVLQDLRARGLPSSRAVVLSGFRAPYYNARGVGEGMARASRHQYGDAADLIVDADGNGRMDDLNGDRRIDLRDTEPITRAIARVEQQHPELLGGLGTYTATGPSGPFAHIDVRGTSARWESGWWKK
jgi:uncharacterized protein YcbK (DUF882 family)